MKKLDLQTPDLTEANITRIAQLFPHVVTEAEDEEGKLVKKVDFDLLRQELSKDIVEDTTERYRLDRPGKKRSILKANTPITKTLRPVKEDSVNWDTTENLYLEGDNFEILKILQESYLGKIKMIYLDPPYNTGKDFVYKDDFKVSKDDYEAEIGTKDDEGGKLFKNTDTNGRYHSDWLSMMYSRLTMGRDLLKDDGVIFISIGENEIHNLRKICDEIFGEENLIAQLVWENKEGGGSSDSKYFRIKHEYILCYGKHKDIINIKGEIQEEDESYAFQDEYVKERGRYKLIKLNSFSIQYSNSLDYEIAMPNGKKALPSENGKKGCWRRSKAKFEWGLKNGFVEFKKNTDGDMRVYTKQYFKVDNENKPTERCVPYRGVIAKFSSTQASKQLENLFGKKYFDYSKPLGLLDWLIDISSNSEDIILDFFSGSATTAHAVIQLNAENGGNRKFIMAQLPEETDPESEAYKDGYKHITEIGKERIRRAGKKILEDNKDKKGIKSLDIGFRVYKTDTSNMKDVYYHPSQISQEKLGLFVSNVKDDRTPEDLLTQVMLDLGLTLDLSIEEKKIKGNKIFFVAGNSLVACFDEKIDFAIVDEIAESQPLKVVFRDSSFADDKDRINVETRMKRLSPETIVSVI